jgi:isopentenyl-diphosphate delta-isomerase
MMDQIESRKDEHVRIALEKDVSSSKNHWDDVILTHNALPEINKDDIDLKTNLIGKKLDAPIIISAMTGGYKLAKEINERLAYAAEQMQVGMGVGSQRAALTNPQLVETYSIVKKYDIPLRIANIGASQLVIWDYEKTIKNIKKIISMIDAHAVAICLNFLQEVVQYEGEAEANGCLEHIKKLANTIDTPIIVKESGAGISTDVAKRLSKTKIAAIDVGGKSGTSFAAIEHFRARMHFDRLHAKGGKTFWDWGIPTPDSIKNVRKITDWNIPIIATGGLRHGLDAAKAIALGADCAGFAKALLQPATKSKQSAVFEVDSIIKELRAAMFLTGSDSISKLNNAEVRYEFKT